MSTNHHGLTSDDIPPAPFSGDELREQWNAQADVFDHWDNLGLDEQLGWAQARAIAADRAQRAPRDLPTPPVVEAPAVEAEPTPASAEPLWRVMEKAWEQRQAIRAMLTTEADRAERGGVIADTSPPPLSPAARAVVDAAYALPLKDGQPSIASALRAAADEGENFYDPHKGKVSAVRTDWILAIAAELDGHSG
jgi:hypothetical protein